MNITANSLKIHHTLDGRASGPVVTMSHSLAANLSMWDPQLPTLTSRYRVLRYDTRGHGDTEVPGGAYSLDKLAEDLRALLEALGIAQTHFVGLSMGGIIGQTLALKYPRVLKSLVLCDTTSRIPAEAKPVWDERIRVAETQGMEPLVEPTLARWFTEPFRAQRHEVFDRVRAMIRSTDPRGYVGCSHAIAACDLTDRLQTINLPTVIIVGEDDPATPVAAARTIHEQIKGSELRVLKSASHLSNMEQAEEFNRVLASFLATVENR
ncbi:MAG: 3-oxoadipate enol-lactonase [Candidatus Methylomirabilia bacterium]